MKLNRLVRSRAEFASLIGGAWRASVESFFQCGRHLIAAKAALPHGVFEKMTEEDLPFSPRTAQRLMAIARDQRLVRLATNPTHVSLLPPSWGTLYELTRLDDDAFACAVDSGVIHAEMDRADVEKLIRPPPILPLTLAKSTATVIPITITHEPKDDVEVTFTREEVERAAKGVSASKASTYWNGLVAKMIGCYSALSFPEADIVRLAPIHELKKRRGLIAELITRLQQLDDRIAKLSEE